MASPSAMSAAASSLLDVAIRALVQSGAPRRTVAATAAAMTSVLLADVRGGASVRGGAAAPPTAAQQRRTKRKQKAAKEKAELVPALPSSGDGGDHGTGHGEGRTTEPMSAVASDFSCEVMPPLRCLHCSQDFHSRNALFGHLQSVHAEPRPAAILSLQPPPWQLSAPQRLEQGGGPASSSVHSSITRVVDVPAPHGPAKPGRSRKGPYAERS